MKIATRLLAVLLCFATVLGLAACGETKPAAPAADIRTAQSVADLSGLKIAAQSGTFHADALSQIPEAVTSTYPDFTDLLTALKSQAIDGYIAEEPTALAVCASDSALGYLPLVNNDTGFKATAADVGVAVGLKKGNALREKINTALAEADEASYKGLMENAVTMAAGQSVSALSLQSTPPAAPNGTFKVAMECAYQPFNWTETGAVTLGAVPISGEGKEGLYANGYDVQVAQYIANKLGMKLEIYALEWDSLIPAVQSGTVDAIIAGMSPTAERAQEIDFTDTYYESNLVVIYNK